MMITASTIMIINIDRKVSNPHVNSALDLTQKRYLVSKNKFYPGWWWNL